MLSTTPSSSPYSSLSYCSAPWLKSDLSMRSPLTTPWKLPFPQTSYPLSLFYFSPRQSSPYNTLYCAISVCYLLFQWKVSTTTAGTLVYFCLLFFVFPQLEVYCLTCSIFFFKKYTFYVYTYICINILQK